MIILGRIAKIFYMLNIGLFAAKLISTTYYKISVVLTTGIKNVQRLISEYCQQKSEYEHPAILN